MKSNSECCFTFNLPPGIENEPELQERGRFQVIFLRKRPVARVRQSSQDTGKQVEFRCFRLSKSYGCPLNFDRVWLSYCYSGGDCFPATRNPRTDLRITKSVTWTHNEISLGQNQHAVPSTVYSHVCFLDTWIAGLHPDCLARFVVPHEQP